MPKSKVALVKCPTYDEQTVYQAVSQGISLLGGVSQFITAGERILIKPNVLYGSNPNKCVTTHPAVFRAMAIILKEACANPYYGDSPGFGSPEANMKRARLKPVADELEIKLADFNKGRRVVHKDALLVKNFMIAQGVLDSDGLVNMPKLKTHPLVRLTGAVKNLFGCVPGLRKGQYHAKLADPYDFATMLVDINTLIKPRLCVMDGIMAMEGNGPRSGTPKQLGVLLFSTDPVALDATACRIVGLNPEFVPTSFPGEKSNLGTYHSENIEILGEKIASFIDLSFDVPRSAPDHCTSSRLRAFIKNRICERPTINKEKCTNCGLCVRMCPVTPKAIDWNSGDKSVPPTYNYDRCIRCYCCQEMCPSGAVYVETPLIERVLSR